MKLKWQWFVGGRIMFWVTITMIVALVFSLIVTYIIDPVAKVYMEEQSVDETSIRDISERYLAELGIEIDKPVTYRFVRYHDRTRKGDTIVLGTFHKWNDTYFINISVDLYRMEDLERVVIHETRHMIVEYLKDEKIMDIVKHTEEIAEEKNAYYNNLFNSGVYLLKKKQGV